MRVLINAVLSNINGSDIAFATNLHKNMPVSFAIFVRLFAFACCDTRFNDLILRNFASTCRHVGLVRIRQQEDPCVEDVTCVSESMRIVSRETYIRTKQCFEQQL